MTKSIYIQSIYIVNAQKIAKKLKYLMGILWECYGNPMGQIAKE